MAINKITKRWFVNNFVVILAVLIVVEILLALGVKNFYYNSVEKFIKSQGMAILNLIDKSYKDSSSNLEFEIRSIVEDFDQKDKMELMLLNCKGKILLTSNGFGAYLNEKIYDDNNTIESINKDILSQKYSQRVYKLNGENVIAVTYPIEAKIKDVSYIEFISSVKYVDRQIAIIIAISVLIGIAIILLVIISSSYFIQSIVVPVDEIGKTAKKITQGDFKARLEVKTDDEIGELCETINHMAEELAVTENMKNEFISSISHELRTPLTAIRGWAETVNSCDSNDEELVRKGMRVIISETERLSMMVEELLNFSGLQSGNMKLMLTKLDLIAELEDILIVFEERAKKEKIKLESKLSDECIPINGDKNRLRQVFTNIIDNALKYSEQGAKVIVTAEKNTKFALVKVMDNGCGIRPEDVPKIKTKFYKANYSKRGSGIGLAVADEIVRLHNGSLDVYSVEGKGTTIVVQIPILVNKC